MLIIGHSHGKYRQKFNAFTQVSQCTLNTEFHLAIYQNSKGFFGLMKIYLKNTILLDLMLFLSSFVIWLPIDKNGCIFYLFLKQWYVQFCKRLNNYIFLGVGYCAVFIAFYVSFYYNVIIGWSLYYVASSFSWYWH